MGWPSPGCWRRRTWFPKFTVRPWKGPRERAFPIDAAARVHPPGPRYADPTLRAFVLGRRNEKRNLSHRPRLRGVDLGGRLRRCELCRAEPADKSGSNVGRAMASCTADFRTGRGLALRDYSHPRVSAALP